MSQDEEAIRDLVAKWLEASRAGDTESLLKLMADDVVFLVPGQEPFGKTAFAAASQSMQGMHMEAISEIRELKGLGDWAFLRGHPRVAMTPPGGSPRQRTGYTLSLFHKQSDGRWLLARDANLLTDVT